MILNILVYFSRRGHNKESFFIFLIFLAIVGVGYLANKVTRGYTIKYIEYDMPEFLRWTLVTVHAVGAVLPALVLPNNYLSEIDFFQRLYTDNALWIPVTMLVLLLSLIILLGTIFTLLVTVLGLKKIENKNNT